MLIGLQVPNILCTPTAVGPFLPPFRCGVVEITLPSRRGSQSACVLQAEKASPCPSASSSSDRRPPTPLQTAAPVIALSHPLRIAGCCLSRSIPCRYRCRRLQHPALLQVAVAAVAVDARCPRQPKPARPSSTKSTRHDRPSPRDGRNAPRHCGCPLVRLSKPMSA